MQDPKYFPIDRGVYEVGPGLKNLGMDLGQGEFDKKVFQIDSQFSIARKNKIDCLRENPSKYILRHELPASAESKVGQVVLEMLTKEYPETFVVRGFPGTLVGHQELECGHTKDRISFDSNFQLVDFKSGYTGPGPELAEQFPRPKSLLDALLLQVQEDLAITRRTDPETDFLAYLNLCSASHWSPADKIGKNFGKVHAPIPGNEKLVKAAKNLVEAMINKGPFVRFVWSFVTDTRLNHHPEPPPGVDLVQWKGRSFDESKDNPFYLRVERQVTWGVPELDISIFTIRISFIPALEIRANFKWAEQMRLALQSMSEPSRQYKGVAHCFDKLIAFLGG